MQLAGHAQTEIQGLMLQQFRLPTEGALGSVDAQYLPKGENDEGPTLATRNRNTACYTPGAKYAESSANTRAGGGGGLYRTETDGDGGGEKSHGSSFGRVYLTGTLKHAF